MINKNELRLGNLVILRGRIAEIQQLGLQRCIALDDFAEYEDLEPIELTEEWLLKFGFERMPTNSKYDYLLDDFHLNIDPDLENGYWVEGLGLMKSFQYVHQLQ